MQLSFISTKKPKTAAARAPGRAVLVRALIEALSCALESGASLYGASLFTQVYKQILLAYLSSLGPRGLLRQGGGKLCDGLAFHLGGKVEILIVPSFYKLKIGVGLFTETQTITYLI